MFVRISESGEVSYSQRLTVRAPCQLTVSLYPLDIQTCHLNITSFAHSRLQVNYSWAETPVTMANIRWETWISISSDMFKTGSVLCCKLGHWHRGPLHLLHHLPEAQLQEGGRILRAASLHPTDHHSLLLLHLVLAGEECDGTILSVRSEQKKGVCQSDSNVSC